MGPKNSWKPFMDLLFYLEYEPYQNYIPHEQYPITVVCLLRTLHNDLRIMFEWSSLPITIIPFRFESNFWISNIKFGKVTIFGLDACRNCLDGKHRAQYPAEAANKSLFVSSIPRTRSHTVSVSPLSSQIDNDDDDNTHIFNVWLFWWWNIYRQLLYLAANNSDIDKQFNNSICAGMDCPFIRVEMVYAHWPCQ